MNKKLMTELCPQGVEFKKLGEVCNISRGRVISKEYLKENEGDFPVYSSQTADNGVIGKIQTYDYEGEYLTWTTDGAHAGTVFYRNEKFSITNVCGLLKLKTNTILAKFVYYVLCIVMKNYVSSGMGNPKLMSNVVEKIQIPIPPFPIQQAIVNILDKFTALEAELEAELEARKMQYEHYCCKLLSFSEIGEVDVKWSTLNEICIFEYGKPLKEAERMGGDYPVLGSNGIVGYHNDFFVNAPCIIIGRKGSAGAINWVEKNCYPIDTAFYVNLKNNEVNLKYLYYYLEKDGLTPEKQVGGVPGLNRNDAYSKKIPIPSLEEQARIVAILDKFDSLVNDISEGLPAEIKMRHQQYEFYRNKLLTFKSLKNIIN